MQVLYEDNHLIAVSKTCNEIVQGDKTGDTPLSDMLKQYIKDKYNKLGEVFIGVPHRLDRPTSGVVLFARTSKALERLNEMFRQKSQPVNPSSSQPVNSSFHQSIIKKTYWAIVEHAPVPEEGTLEHWLVRNEKLNKSFIAKPNAEGAKLAVLTYRTLARGERYTLLEVNLLTGRHHQIRCQLAAIGCPIKGDLKYGARRSNPDGGICLHARQIDFIHPVKKEPVSITAPVPNETLWHTLAKHVCLFLTLFLLTCCEYKQSCDGFSSRPAACPRTEWDTAVAILMHEPGIELFDGVIHPSAGLFEHYFNVDSAAAEHRHYQDMLRANGIRVYTVSSILQSMNIDTLRYLTEQVLHYDLSELPPADTAEIGESYRRQTLSLMSREDMIRCLLLQPTVHLAHVDNNTGCEATYEHQALMNLYFTRDQSISTPRGQVICRMNSSQRAPETRIIRACYGALGITPVLEIMGDGRLEGGDYFPAGTLSFIGCGMRTNREAIRQMMQADAFGHDTVVVVCDHRFWQMQMHLDTYFNLIDKDLCTMVERRLQAQEGDVFFVTADVYARAKGENEYRLIEQQVPFVSLLKQRGMTIIPIQEEDEMHYANNFLTIAPRHIMAVGGQSPALQQAFRDHGVTVEWIPLEQLINGYGAAHCMTQVILRR